MKNKKLKIIAMVAVFLLIVWGSHMSFAATKNGKDLTDLFNGKTLGSEISTTEGENMLTEVIGSVLSVIRIVGIGISVIILTYMGIKYMLAAPSEKADIKGQCIKFVIGVVVFVGATTILEIVKNFAQGIWTT